MQAENGNAYIWDLWAKVLAAAGANETSLDVRWEAVRRFPDSLVTRMAMIVALAGNGRLELAEHLFHETAQDFPNEVIEPRLLQAEQWNETASEMKMHRPQDPLVAQLRRVIADEQFFRGMEGKCPSIGSQLEPQMRSVLESLRNRAVLLQRYFAPPSEVAIASETPEPESPTSELELVVAYRKSQWPQLGDQSLDLWLNARPSSYSVRLLALARGINGHGPDPEEFSRVQSAFPQHHNWNQWLGYAFAARHERKKLRQEARDQGFWEGRLSAVYPDLNVPYSRFAVAEPEPLRRLFEDVALANAGAGLPQF